MRSWSLTLPSFLPACISRYCPAQNRLIVTFKKTTGHIGWEPEFLNLYVQTLLRRQKSGEGVSFLAGQIRKLKSKEIRWSSWNPPTYAWARFKPDASPALIPVDFGTARRESEWAPSLTTGCSDERKYSLAPVSSQRTHIKEINGVHLLTREGGFNGNKLAYDAVTCVSLGWLWWFLTYGHGRTCLPGHTCH